MYLCLLGIFIISVIALFIFSSLCFLSFGELKEEDIRAALEYASKLLKNEVVLPLEA